MNPFPRAMPRRCPCVFRSVELPPPRLRPVLVIEALEQRAMLAGLGPESWIAGGIGSPLGGAAAVSMGGAILTCSSPTPGSSDISPASAAGASVTATGGVVWLPSTAGSGGGNSTSSSSGAVNTNGPALSSQVGGGSGAGAPATSAGTGSSAQGGNDLWLSYGAGSGAGTSTFSSTGAVNTNGPALSSQIGGGGCLGSRRAFGGAV